MKPLVLALLLATAAVTFGEGGANQLPFTGLFDRDELARSFVRQRIHPFGEREFSFDVVVPKDWEFAPLSVTREQILEDDIHSVTLCRLRPPADEEVSISVRYLRLSRDKPIDVAIELETKRLGEVVARQAGNLSGRAVQEALVRVVDEAGAGHLVRVTASRHDDLVLLVEGSAPEARYDEVKRVLATAAVGFIPGEGTIRREFEPGTVRF